MGREQKVCKSRKSICNILLIPKIDKLRNSGLLRYTSKTSVNCCLLQQGELGQELVLFNISPSVFFDFVFTVNIC